jgi:hypothetical protein
MSTIAPAVRLGHCRSRRGNSRISADRLRRAVRILRGSLWKREKNQLITPARIILALGLSILPELVHAWEANDPSTMTLTVDTIAHKYNFQNPGSAARTYMAPAAGRGGETVKVTLNVDVELPNGWKGWAYGAGLGDNTGEVDVTTKKMQICVIETNQKECSGKVVLRKGYAIEDIIFQLNYADKDGKYQGFQAIDIGLDTTK